jgi:AhpD family alkylhydroperoxidase
MSKKIAEFIEERLRLNDHILELGTTSTRRFFGLDTRVYESGALPSVTKELMGLTASLVMRCDDCVTYHLIECHKDGVTRDQFMEAFDVALIVGGSIVIPHLRKAVDQLDELFGSAD